MAVFTFNWQLQRSNTYHPKKNLYTSTRKINSEWNLMCLWSKNGIPEFLEICRNSTAEEILVSGTYELNRGSSCVKKRKFVRLIEANIATTLLDLDYFEESGYGNGCYYEGSYSLIGTLKIPAVVSDSQIPAIERQKECAKVIKFESLLNLSTNFECLLDSKENYFSDVNLECEAYSFSAHKSILSARSAVFAAMFKTEMKENRNNKVDIKDISPHILKAMLTFIYTAKTGLLSTQSAGELLFAADKYLIQDLKNVCSDYLKTCVSARNVLNILVLGYMHDEKLKDFAMYFICRLENLFIGKFEVMQKTEEWKTLCRERPALAIDVLTCLVKSKDEKLKERRN